MAGSEHAEIFKITVREGGKIHVKYGSREVDQYDLNRDKLEEGTIQTLVSMLRKGRLRDDEVKVLGRELYSVLFSDWAGGLLNHILVNTTDQESKPLRVELVFERGQEELASWPWEYLYCPLKFGWAGTERFLVDYSDRLLLTRSLPSNDPRELLVEEPPIKVLFVAADPHTDNSEGLGSVLYEPLLKQLEGLMEKGFATRIHVSKAGNAGLKEVATFSEFKRDVKEYDPHVIHFLGHGKHDNGVGKLAFMHEEGDTHWVDQQSLANFLTKYRNLRLVFLQACESAFSSPQKSNPYRAVSGVAQRVAHEGIPAVVAMRDKVENKVATPFAQAFYKALVECKPIDVAVQEGRMEIEDRMMTTEDEEGMSSMSHAFGLPVLYLRGSGEMLQPAELSTVRTTPGVQPGTMAPVGGPPLSAEPQSTPPTEGDQLQRRVTG